jgi:hypothetical protein
MMLVNRHGTDVVDLDDRRTVFTLLTVHDEDEQGVEAVGFQ